MDLSIVLNCISGFLKDGLLKSDRQGGLNRRGFLRLARDYDKRHQQAAGDE